MIKLGKIMVTGLISVLSTQIFADINDQKLINAAIKNKVTVAQAIKAKEGWHFNKLIYFAMPI